jgi:hypothetical protein
MVTGFGVRRVSFCLDAVRWGLIAMLQLKYDFTRLVNGTYERSLRTVVGETGRRASFLRPWTAFESVRLFLGGMN